MDKETRRLKRAIATEYVNNINNQTFCRVCGNQPIEWHRHEHEEKPNSRVSSLRAQGVSVQRIQQEINLCIHLCRSCHMKEDGRLEALHKNKPQQKGNIYVSQQPCCDCGKMAKPLRKGRCWTCYEGIRCGGRFHVLCYKCQ